jgi:hypothetical protein
MTSSADQHKLTHFQSLTFAPWVRAAWSCQAYDDKYWLVRYVEVSWLPAETSW